MTGMLETFSSRHKLQAHYYTEICGSLIKSLYSIDPTTDTNSASSTSAQVEMERAET